jgi:hypothetical protein
MYIFMSRVMHCTVVLVLLGIALSSAVAQQIALPPSKQVSIADDSSLPTSGIASESDNVLDFVLDFYGAPTVANHGVAMAGRFLDAEIYDLNGGVLGTGRLITDEVAAGQPVDFQGGIANGPDDLLDRNPFSAPSLASSASDANKDYNVGLATTSEQPGQSMALSGESADDSFAEADAGFLTQPTAKTSGSLPTRLVALGGLCWLWLSHRRKRQLNRLGVKPR